MEITEIVSNHWVQLREMTYDLLEVLEVSDLGLKLEFERSQSIGYQYWCMLGAQESWISLIGSGEWQGFSCSVNSLEGSNVIDDFKGQMQLADELLLRTLKAVDVTQEFNDEATPLSNYMILVEHESHHQGQLINFIYAHDLPIPKSWEVKWALRRE